MESLPSGYRAAVIGASGGIGAAFAEALAVDPRCGAVLCYARSGRAPAGLTATQLDITDDEAIARAAEAAGPLHLVIVATGLLHAADHQPEKDMRALKATQLQRSFLVNATGPALVARHFLPCLPRRERGLFACLSARVGSISDNRVGGWYGYRASKAALNMLMKNSAIEMARRRPETVILTLQPGTVDTGLSKPFQGAVRRETILDPRVSAAHLLQVIDQARPEDSGNLYDWRGERIPF